MLRPAPLFPLDPGDHVCFFYRSDNELLEFLIPYYAEGLRRGEFCFGAQKTHIRDRILSGLASIGIDIDEILRHGALDIRTEDEVYFSSKKFDPPGMIDMLLCSLDEALDRGFTGLRTAGDLCWVQPDQPIWQTILDYEHCVDQCIPGRAMTSICQYNSSALSPAELNAIIDRHGATISEAGTDSSHSCILTRGERHGTEKGTESYRSDVVADTSDEYPSYYYVVHKNEPAEVAGWGVSPSFRLATSHANQIIAREKRN